MMLSFAVSAADIQLTWDTPTEREDGTAIETIDRFNIYHTADGGGTNIIEVDPTLLSYKILDAQEGAHAFQISAVELGQEGVKSDVVPVVVIGTIVITISKPGKMPLTVQVEE
tara:strand:- start:44 stop:382 length:339 start_codon:yes stop_codon:yes gene_type:complete